MKVLKITILICFIIIQKKSFSQSINTTTLQQSEKKNDSITYKIKNEEFRKTGKEMEKKLNNSEINSDLEIKTKNYTIEKSSNIKIDVNPDTRNP